MKPQSAKAKGRKLQQWFMNELIDQLDIDPEDIESRAMGSGGEDLIMAKAAREKFPFSIECKNVERLNFWEAYQQATVNGGKYQPLVVAKKNNTRPLVLMDASDFVNIIKEFNKARETIELMVSEELE